MIQKLRRFAVALTEILVEVAIDLVASILLLGSGALLFVLVYNFLASASVPAIIVFVLVTCTGLSWLMTQIFK